MNERILPRFFVAGLVAGAALFAASSASLAQSMSNNTKDPAAVDLLSQLHETNQTEVELGKMAGQKGSTPDVRSYGKELMSDHSAADRKVEKVARDLGLELSPPTAPSKALQEKQNHDGAVREMLENVSGKDFDRDFLEAMSKDHQKAIQDLTEALNTTSDAKVKALLQELLPKLKEHQQMAEKLLAQAKKS